VLGAAEALVTTDHVLVETWLLVNSRLGFSTAEQVLEEARASTGLELVGPADLEKAWAIGEAFPDQEFSIVDRTSFAVMERLRIDRVATFDHHFAVYRFGRDRRRAFEVVR
jgi:predicted nucleic acid-binding protein